MPYVADLRRANELVDAGQLVGNGQCVTFVHAVVNIPSTAAWRKGDEVKAAASLARGTVIATFDDSGHYGNHTNGTSHAAIYLYQTADGIVVLDQWNGRTKQPPHQRTIRFRNGKGSPVDDGSRYYVVQ